jgi:AcrR family transcriptional regulator
MGIPERKEREKKMRQKQIQDAAKEVFLEKGFRMATMEDIARKAELSPATIYLYFKNRDELYASLNLASLEFLQKEIENISNNGKIPVERKLLTLKKVFLKTYYHDPLILRNILHMQVEGTLGMISSDLMLQIQRITRQCRRGVFSIFEQGIKEGKFINGPIPALSDVVWGLFTGVVVWEISKKTFDSNKNHLESTLDLAFRTLVRGLTKERQSEDKFVR